jgi:acetyltransferase-like isoleucine patch superfamily enzyme
MANPVKIFQILGRFRKRYSNRILHLWIEEYVGFLTRSLPGIEGMFIRWLFYQFLFKEMQSFPMIYPGVYLTHTYGIQSAHNLSINTGAILDGRGGIKLGDGVMIGPYAVITSSHHHSKQTEAAMHTLDHIMAPVIIEDDVWIGAHSFIRGGIRVGQGSVIAAGAVVVADVERYDIVGGNPAKTIGRRK